MDRAAFDHRRAAMQRDRTGFRTTPTVRARRQLVVSRHERTDRRSRLYMQLNEVLERRPEQAETIEPRGRSGGSLWKSERSRSIIIILLAVLFANSTYLLQIFNANPINQLSGLGTTVHPGLLQGENNIDPDIGFTSQALGHRAAVDWLHGEVPWWNPYEGVGAPLAGEMQSAALFPLNTFNLLPNGQIYFRIALELAAGIGTYLLVRRFTRSNAPAVVGGIAFALNGTFSWLFHAPGNPVAFLPFLLLGLEWAREGALCQRRKGWALVAAAIALSIYAGFPETTLLDGLLAALWLVVRAFGLTRRALVTYIQSILLGLLAGVLLAAPILVAFLDYIPYANLGPHNGGVATTSLSANTALPSQVLPYLFGPIKGLTTPAAPLDAFWTFIGGYLGVSLCLLALIGLLGRRYRPLRIALAIWIVVGLARLVGVNWAIHVMNAIPGVKWTIFIRYASPSWELALVVLAVLGLDDLIRRSTARLAVLGCGAAMVVIILLCWHAAQPVFHALVGTPHNRAWAVASLTWSLAMVGGIVVLGLLPDAATIRKLNVGRFRQGALAALVVIDVTAMFMVPPIFGTSTSRLRRQTGELPSATPGALSLLHLGSAGTKLRLLLRTGFCRIAGRPKPQGLRQFHPRPPRHERNAGCVQRDHRDEPNRPDARGGAGRSPEGLRGCGCQIRSPTRWARRSEGYRARASSGFQRRQHPHTRVAASRQLVRSCPSTMLGARFECDCS